MKRWLLGGIVGACVGVIIYLLATKKAEPAQPSAVPQPAPLVAAATPPPVPVVLPEVVDLVDLDPLLDPPARAVAGAPFEAETRATPTPSPAPERIPPAVDDPASPLSPAVIITPFFGSGVQLFGLRFHY